MEEDLLKLKHLLFGNDSLEGIPFFSKSPGDTAKVIKQSIEIGEQIKTLDKEETIFHVEFLKDSHAEIWLVNTWRESNTRRYRVQALSAEERLYREKNRIRLEKIAIRLREQGLGHAPGYAEHLANTILKNWKSGDYSRTLKMLDLVALLAEFEDEDKNENK